MTVSGLLHSDRLGIPVRRVRPDRLLGKNDPALLVRVIDGDTPAMNEEVAREIRTGR